MTESNKLFLASDHGGYQAKRQVIERIQKESAQWELTDLGCDDDSSVDYPNFAHKLGKVVVQHNAKGILFCGSGIGMSIAANKVAGVRAALVWDVTSARLCREHNDANVLCLGGRLIGPEVIADIVRVWLETPFSGGRHQRRVDAIELGKG